MRANNKLSYDKRIVKKFEMEKNVEFGKNLPEEFQKYLNNPIIKLEKPFIDDRGIIQPIVDKLMKSAVMITSKK